MYFCFVSEVYVGFSQLEYEVNEDDGFLDISFGVLSGTLNRNITVDVSFASGTAKGTQTNDLMLLLPKKGMTLHPFTITALFISSNIVSQCRSS